MGKTLEPESVSCWINQLREGNHQAASRLWERYGFALQQLAKKRYGGALNAVFDEQDLAQSVFVALWRNAEEGKLDDVQDRNELWWLLLEITRRRALTRLKFNQAQKRTILPSQHMPGPSAQEGVGSLSQISDPRELPPEAMVILHEEHDRFMDLLRDDTLRAIAQRKLQGDGVKEIAKELGVSVRTVIRKSNLIRDIWETHLNDGLLKQD